MGNSTSVTASGLLAPLRFDEPIYVTRPRMPSVEDYGTLLGGVWERRWLTNAGQLHERLEAEVENFLGTPDLRLVSNGMSGLLIALLALEIPPGGEVLTTPFTFPATTHAIKLAGREPVFCDIGADDYNIDPAAVERAVGPNTAAILAVHAFGTRCDVDALAAIGARHGIPVVYDAAHTFGARFRGRALCSYGEASVLSFHATKLFSTAEGGAIVCGDPGMAQRVEWLRDFGIHDPDTVVGPGFNGKMSELHAAFGLLHLPGVPDEIACRRQVAASYERGLAGVPGISTLGLAADPDWNCAYFPVRIDSARFGMTRDRVCDELRAMNVIARKYFSPLCSVIPPYDRLASAAPDRLQNAVRVQREVLCLPIYGDLDLAVVDSISAAFHQLAASA